jgi:hypothetical protein
MKVKDPCMFAMACKIFPFPNGINSIRVIICHVSKLIGENIGEDEDEHDSLDDENNWNPDKLDEDKLTELGDSFEKNLI